MTVRRDVHQLREVEEALRRSEAKYREIFEKIQDIFFQTNDQGLIVEASPSVERYGYTREELIGMPTARVYEDPSKRITLLQLLEDGDITDREVRLRARDGRVVDFSISAHMLRGPDGSPAGMEGCLRDISDRKLAEEELRMHRDRLEELVDGRTAELTRANEELQREVSERGQAEEALGKRTHNLGERVKELNCLYGISNLVHRPDTSLEEILQGTVDLIPPGWQYPEVTCARITFNGQEFRTENFRETVWRQTSDIIVNGERTGAVEVCYLEEKPQRDKGLFLEEERRLINALAERLGRVIERKRAEEALRQPEERFSKVFQASSLAIAISSMRDGRIIDVNDALLEALNYSREEVIGRSSAELGMWADHTVREEIVRGLQTGDAFYDTEVEARGKTGGTLYAHLACVVIELDGEPCLLTITRDITEHKRAEEALRESEQRFRQVLDVSSDMIYKLDLESDTFDYISPSVLEMTGFTREEFIAMGPRGLRRRIHPEDWPDFRRGSEEFVELGSHPRFEYRLQCKDGEYRWLNDNRALVRGESGRPLALVGTVRDVTERRQAEEQARQLHAEQVRANELRRMVRILERMAATLGHELRNPLGVIGNSVYFLANQAQIDGPKAQKHVEIIGHEVASARRVIDDILEFAHVPHLLPAAAGTNAVVDSALARSQIPANIRVVRKLAVDLPPLICDEERLEWAFIDIITNAVQAMPHGGRLGVKTSRSGDDIEVVFSDSGVGIAPENLDKVFEPMFTTKLRGIGLGLTVVRRTVEQHGGGISVKSRLGWGAIFKITLPRDCRPFAAKGGRVA